MSAVTSLALPTSPVSTPELDISLHHRDLFNGVAGELGLGFKWQSDALQSHLISGYGDLDLSFKDRIKYQTWRFPFAKNKALQRDLGRVRETLESKRQAAVANSVAVTVPYATNPDLSHLTTAEREVIRRLLEAVPILKELDILFKDDRGLKIWEHVRQQGDAKSLWLFEKLSQNAGYYSRPAEEQKFCSPANNFPNPRPTYGTVMPSSLLPTNLSEQALEESARVMTGATKDPMENPYLSPLTVLTPDPSDPIGWKWTKINQDPRFQDRILRLAEIIHNAASTPGIDRTLKAQLLSTESSLLSDDPTSMFSEDKTWVIQSSGHLEIGIGPSGGYSPMSKVCGATLYIAVERKGAADKFKKYLLPLMPKLEKRLSELLGENVYKARTEIPTNSVVRVVDAIVSTGATYYPTLAFVGPDSGPVAKAGRVKRIIIANHHEAKANKMLLPIAKVALVPELAPLVSESHFVDDSTGHEMMHAIGPRPDDLVTVDGKLIRTHDAIGAANYDAIEESKANVAGLVAFVALRDEGIAEFDADYVRQTMTTYAAGLMRQMRFGNRAHGSGAAAELGWFFKEGALKIKSVTTDSATENRIDIDFTAMEKALEKLWVHISRIQATGDKGGAKAYLEDMRGAIPESLYGIVDRINAAGIPVDVALSYPDLSGI